MKQLQKADIDEFKARFRGDLLLPGDADYDEVRQIWNAMIDRRPALIARCTSPDDVVQGVNFARQHELLVSIRGGGHNIAGNAVCNDGLMIDLSLMKGVRVALRRSLGPLRLLLSSIMVHEAAKGSCSRVCARTGLKSAPVPMQSATQSAFPSANAVNDSIFER